MTQTLWKTLWTTWGQPPEEERHALSAWRSALLKPRNKQPGENKSENGGIFRVIPADRRRRYADSDLSGRVLRKMSR